MIFQTFPREVGIPRKIVTNQKEYYDFINYNNGKRNALYTTIYKFKLLKNNYKGVYNTAVVDKLFFDFDDKECDAYMECKKLHMTCKAKNLKHCIFMSGRGYHLYIFTTDYDPKYKKEAIRGGQEFFINKLQLKADRQVVGDSARLARIPNTWHGIAKRFCIPLTEEQFSKGDDHIKTVLAKHQNLVKNIFIGTELFDLKSFDMKPTSDFCLDIPESTTVDINKNIFNMAPPCIKNLLRQPQMDYKKRYLVILYFKEKGYSSEEVFEILRRVLTPAKLQHCVRDERQIQYLFERDDLVFPCCENIKIDGYCTGKCEMFGKVVYH